MAKMSGTKRTVLAAPFARSPCGATAERGERLLLERFRQRFESGGRVLVGSRQSREQARARGRFTKVAEVGHAGGLVVRDPGLLAGQSRVHGSRVHHQVVLLPEESVAGESAQALQDVAAPQVPGDDREVLIDRRLRPVEEVRVGRLRTLRLEPGQLLGARPATRHLEQRGLDQRHGRLRRRRGVLEHAEQHRQEEVEAIGCQQSAGGRARDADEALDSQSLASELTAQLGEHRELARHRLSRGRRGERP